MANKYLSHLSLADKVTLLRVLLIPVFVSVMFYFNQERLYLRWVAFAVFTIAVLTDFFDGLVARLKKEKSDIGMIIDPLADKLLLLSVFIVLYALRSTLPLRYTVPLGLVLLIVSRDIVIIFGAITLHYLKIDLPIAPSYWGKFTTFFQMMTILSLLGDWPIFPYIWPMAAVFTLISGIGYFLRGALAINGKTVSTSR